MRGAALFTLIIGFLPVQSYGQLSQNSGINSSDTWVALDLTVSDNAQVNLAAPYYSPTTQTTSSTLNNAPIGAFHVESGYDSGGGLVMNIWPKGKALFDPYPSDTTGIAFIRMAGGQITALAQDGTPLSLVFPPGIPSNWPFSLLGSNPGPSSLSNLVVPNVPVLATVSRSNISIKSSINGAATNYPLSVSYAWGPQQYFSGPEYTATTSGSTLTGGID